MMFPDTQQFVVNDFIYLYKLSPKALFTPFLVDGEKKRERTCKVRGSSRLYILWILEIEVEGLSVRHYVIKPVSFYISECF